MMHGQTQIKIRMCKTGLLACNHGYPEEGCHKFLQNIGNHLACHKASHPQDYGPNIHCCENKSHKYFYQPWRWKQHVLLKCWYQPTRLLCNWEHHSLDSNNTHRQQHMQVLHSCRLSSSQYWTHKRVCALVHNKVINIMSHHRWTDIIQGIS